jgi:hypothetical protein
MLGQWNVARRGPKEPVSSPRRQHVNDAAGNQLARLGGIGGHVRRGGVGLEGVEACPFLDDDETVGAELGLVGASALGVDRRGVFDAAGLGVDGRPLSAITEPLSAAGFVIERLVEPVPVPEFRDADAEDYAKLIRAPSFVIFRARKDRTPLHGA